MGLPGGVGRGFTQPGGAFTPVYPQQVVNPSSTIAPFSTSPVTEQTGVMSFACGHLVDEPMVLREYDYTLGSSVALVCCPQCSCITGTIYPYEAWLNPVTNPVTIP
jgi:hypothetical protein